MQLKYSTKQGYKGTIYSYNNHSSFTFIINHMFSFFHEIKQKKRKRTATITQEQITHLYIDKSLT
jgi:hypothetical protein